MQPTLPAKRKPIQLVKDILSGWAWEDQRNQHAVVFVHGFLGKPDETWRQGPGISSFPELLMSDPSMNDYDVFVYSYKTGVFSSKSIDNVARQMDTQLFEPLLRYRLVLLAHSMGGLACMQSIVRRLARGEKTSIAGLLLYGTPTMGVEWVGIVKLALAIGSIKLPALGIFTKLFSRSKQLEEMANASAFLQQLQSHWILRVVNGGYPSEPAERRAWIPVRVVTGNEDWVVKEHSSKGVYGEIDWNPLDLDHRSLVKPTGTSDACYQLAARFLNQCRLSSLEAITALRHLSDWVWSLRSEKLIRDWKFEIHFHEPGRPIAGSYLALPGFSIMEVRRCAYSLILPDEPFLLGLTLGTIASENAWEGNPVYLHQIFLNAIKPGDRTAISRAVSAKLAEPNAWDAFFENVRIRISEVGSRQWFDLIPGALERSESHLLTEFTLPEEARSLIGREVRIDLSFRTLGPSSICDFDLQFPWLTLGFDTQIVVHGKPEFLTVLSQLFGRTQPEITIDDTQEPAKVRIRGESIVTPGSSAQIQWLPCTPATEETMNGVGHGPKKPAAKKPAAKKTSAKKAPAKKAPAKK